jgi:hypothetical protein
MLDIKNTLLYNEGCSVDKAIDNELNEFNSGLAALLPASLFNNSYRCRQDSRPAMDRRSAGSHTCLTRQ